VALIRTVFDPRRGFTVLQGGDEESEELWGEADALVVVVGKDDILYSKSTTLHV
jgi:hypothetical protein